MGPDLLRRVRWGNVALACAVLAALAGVIVWPLLSTARPALPPDAARPLIASPPEEGPESRPGAPPVSVATEPRPRAASRDGEPRRGTRGGAAGRRATGARNDAQDGARNGGGERGVRGERAGADGRRGPERRGGRGKRSGEGGQGGDGRRGPERGGGPETRGPQARGPRSQPGTPTVPPPKPPAQHAAPAPQAPRAVAPAPRRRGGTVGEFGFEGGR